jgi:hypothetical protein
VLTDRYIDGNLLASSPLERAVNALAVSHAALLLRFGDGLLAVDRAHVAGGHDAIFKRLSSLDGSPAQFAAVTTDLVALGQAICRSTASGD